METYIKSNYLKSAFGAFFFFFECCCLIAQGELSFFHQSCFP